MEDKELLSIWNTSNQKLDEILHINREIVETLTRQKLNKTINELRLPKQKMLVLGIPYTLLLVFVTSIAILAEAWLVMLGFGVISVLMVAVINGYIYHLYLINKIKRSDEIIDVQKNIAELKISSFSLARFSLLQIPFWSICWMSVDALQKSPWIYGGVNLIVFLILTYITYRLLKNFSLEKPDTRISKLLLSGNEWEPILRSTSILEQLREKSLSQ